MIKSGASKREPATEPTPLELVEIARALPARQWEKAWASQSYAVRLQALKAALREARHVWQVAREVSAIEETFFDAAAKSDAELASWQKALNDGSERIVVTKAAEFLGWTPSVFRHAWRTLIPWKFCENELLSKSFLQLLKAHKHKAEQEAKALKARRQRARRKGNASQK